MDIRIAKWNKFRYIVNIVNKISENEYEVFCLKNIDVDDSIFKNQTGFESVWRINTNHIGRELKKATREQVKEGIDIYNKIEQKVIEREI